MKKIKKSPKKLNLSKRKINLKLALLIGSVILIFAVLFYGTLQKTFFGPQAKMKYKARYKDVNDCRTKFKGKLEVSLLTADQLNSINGSIVAQEVFSLCSTGYKTFSIIPGDNLSGGGVKCCINTATYDYYTKNYKKGTTSVPNTGANVVVTEGKTPTSCGKYNVNCNTKFGGNSITSKDGTKTYSVVCAGDINGANFKCAINVGDETYCDSSKIAGIKNGSSQETTGKLFKFCESI